MTALADIHVALADQVRARVARASGINFSPWPMSGMPVPCIEVWPREDYVDPYGESDSDDGITRVRLRLKVETSTDPESGFMVMTDLLDLDGPSSLRAAVMSDRTLGNKVDDVWVPSGEFERWETDGVTQTGWVPVDVLVQKG